MFMFMLSITMRRKHIPLHDRLETCGPSQLLRKQSAENVSFLGFGFQCYFQLCLCPRVERMSAIILWPLIVIETTEYIVIDLAKYYRLNSTSRLALKIHPCWCFLTDVWANVCEFRACDAKWNSVYNFYLVCSHIPHSGIWI